MRDIWSTEGWALVLAVVTLVLLGLLTGQWIIASLFTAGTYVAWLYHRLLKLEKWIRQGTKLSQAYEDSGFVGIIIRQLRQQKKAQNKQKRRTRRLLQGLNENISALPDATVLLNRNFQVEWCNQPARQLLNLRSPQDLGYKINNLIREPELQAYLNDPAARDYIEIDSPTDPEVTLQVKVVSYAGKKLLLIARNISEQKKLQQSLKNFVANASHELKSPLTVISGHLEMLKGEIDPGEPGRRSLETALRQAGRMRELIQSLLLLSQVESRHLDPEEGDRLPLTELMANVMAAMEKFPDRDRIILEHPDGLFLLGVNVEIESICINLIENALKYSAPGTPVRVCWEESPQGEFVFSVEDSGPGIDADEIAKITERHYRGAQSRVVATGSGLGLAIVEQASRKHGARLDIESRPGSGSRFRVSFPPNRCLHE